MALQRSNVGNGADGTKGSFFLAANNNGKSGSRDESAAVASASASRKRLCDVSGAERTTKAAGSGGGGGRSTSSSYSSKKDFVRGFLAAASLFVLRDTWREMTKAGASHLAEESLMLLPQQRQSVVHSLKQDPREQQHNVSSSDAAIAGDGRHLPAADQQRNSSQAAARSMTEAVSSVGGLVGVEDPNELKPNVPQHRQFPDAMEDLVVGMGRVSRRDFMRRFDTGHGIDDQQEGNSEVLILYGSEASVPVSASSGSGIPLYGSADDATSRCDVLKVVHTDARKHSRNPKKLTAKERDHKVCLALVGQWSSYHVHKFERKSLEVKNKKKDDGELAPVETHHRPDVPPREIWEASDKILKSYLSVLDDALARLKPIAERVAYGDNNEKGEKKKGPIIVMVANIGQMKYFLNFICSATARNFDLSRVLLFATDEETFKLAGNMKIAAFYDPDVFASIPKGAAVDYHDVNYGKIMMSKVYCVHLVNRLGYDVLFQDLDLVWYRDPILYFEEKFESSLGKNGFASFDMYIQHDGSHHPKRFAPLAANTGFYYVRHNKRTEHFFSVFARRGDLVLHDKSHQAAFSALANEHMNLHGLRIKVLADAGESDLFLSGFHFHARARTMKRLSQGKHTPVIFHANWLPGKEKEPVLRRVRNWFLKDGCDVSGNKSNSSDFHIISLEESGCCLAQPAPEMV